MSLVPVVAICPKCGEVRLRSSRPYAPGETLNPDDFLPEDGQAAPVAGTPTTCSFCDTVLAFRRDPTSITTETRTLPSHADNGHGRSPAPVTLFAAAEGEDIIATREPSPGILIIQTTRRVVLLDLNAALITIQESPRG
jgi:hypothetical protein